LKATLSFRPKSYPGLRLRSVEVDDAERLRLWKNANRQHFFFKEEISSATQARWMEDYLRRPDDFMFIVELDGRPVGCMGLRLIAGKGDVYNVILGDPETSRRGLMGTCLRMMLAFGRGMTDEIGLKVLKGNPATRFYERNGFAVVGDRGDHLEMAVDWRRFEPVELS
jgi:RimJ/RimL family protein N-acetyltransferase